MGGTSVRSVLPLTPLHPIIHHTRRTLTDAIMTMNLTTVYTRLPFLDTPTQTRMRSPAKQMCLTELLAQLAYPLLDMQTKC